MPKIEQKQIVSAIIVVGFILAGAILLKDSKPPVKAPKQLPVAGTGALGGGVPRPVSSDDHIVGNINAKVIVVEYSDLECPFCKVFHQTMQQVMQNNTGDIAWVYRHYPIPQLHQKAFREAEATECAWDQGGNEAFWVYTNKIFEVTTSNDGLADTELSNIAQFAGLNLGEFENCLSSGKFTAKVQADFEDGSQAGVTGTPSSFIFVDGELADTIPGAEPYASVAQKINNFLK